MKIAVIGTGYVGLVSGACFADSGNFVTCVDVDEAKIEALKNGVIPIYEPGLETLVKRNYAEERLLFTTDINEAIDNSLMLFIAVGTPSDEDGSADLSHVLDVAKSIGKRMSEYKIIVDKSTVPVGTAQKVKETIREELEKRGLHNLEFDVVSNPEFLKEGAAIDDFMKPDRVVVGCDDPRTAELMKELYSPFVRTSNPILIMSPAAAEMTKYASNCMLATRLTFMNELANLCDICGVDVNDVRKGMGSDSRIGHAFLFPGAGYGGSCFPKDVRALIHTADENAYNMQLLKSVEDVNNKQKEILFKKLSEALGTEDMRGRKIGVWGLAFKANTDDMRESSAINLIDSLLEVGAEVHAYDPAARERAKEIYGDKIVLKKRSYDVLENADALVIVTEWNEFRRPDFERMKTMMKNHLIIDGRNLYNPKSVREMGFDYRGIGR